MVSESKMGHQSELLQNSKTSESSDLKPPPIDFKNILSMDDIVRLSLINDNWKIVESKRSRMISTLPKFAVKSLTPPPVDSKQEISTLWTGRIESQKSSGHNGFLSHAKSEITQGDVSADKIDGILEKDTVIRQNVTVTRSQNFGSGEFSTVDRISNDFDFHLNGDSDDESDIDEALLSITSKKKKEIPLPEFDDLNSDDEEEEYRSENQWSLKDKGSLFLYENLVGVDLREPLFMFVPQSNGNNTPRIGELDVDQLSELSENDSKSEGNPELDSDLEADDSSHRHTGPARMDSCIQTDNSSSSLLTKDMGTMTATDIIAEITAERSKTGPSAALVNVSSELYETDPKFIQSPESCVEVLEGEAVSISCRFTGTQPIDAFWFRDVDEVTQLEENDRCDIGCSSGVFCLDLFNTTMKDSGQYLCIGVNTKGHCVRSFQIKILENRNPKFPASFSVFPQGVETLERTEAKLSCKVSGYPPPRVLWFRGNERLKNGEKYKIESSAGSEHHLTVRDVGNTSTGYLVMAQNLLGKVKATVHIHIKTEDMKEKRNAIFEGAAKSPYPDLDELVEIVQKVSPSVKETKPLNFSSRFLSRVSAIDTPNLPNEEPLTSKQHTWTATRSNSIEEHTKFKDWQRKHDDPISPTTRDFDKDLSNDDEQRIDVSYRDFERLYNAKLITRSQLKSGRVWKKDLVKIHNFLQGCDKNSTSNNSRSLDTVEDDETPVYVDCGLKEINSNFYRRDYVVNESSKYSGRNNFSKQNHQAMHRLARASSLQSPLEGTWPPGGTHMEHRTAETGQLEGAVTSSQLEDVTLPCVRELCSRFSGGALSPELRQDNASPLKRVYSLTGRSVPQFLKERIERRLGATDHINKQPKELDSYTQNVAAPILLQSPVDIRDGLGAQGSSYHSKVKPKIGRSISLSVSNEQDASRFKNARQNTYSPVDDRSKPAWQTDIRGEVVRPQKKPINTVVIQRAAYWDKRVLDEPPSEPFPKMMTDSDTVC